jgi:hypothetical protein
MSTHSVSESFVLQSLLEGAFTEYEKRAGRNLVGHPLLIRLKQCNSVESITKILEEQAQALRDFKGDDGKMMKSLTHAVHFLYALSTSPAIRQALPFIVRYARTERPDGSRACISLTLILQPFLPVTSIVASIGILLGVSPSSAHYVCVITRL